MEYARKIPIAETKVNRKASELKRGKSRKIDKRKTVNKKIVKRQIVKGKVDKPKVGKRENLLKIITDDRTRWKQFEPELRKILPLPTDVLKNIKYKARAINFLDSLNGEATWDSNGTVSVKGKELPYSNIEELVDAYFNNSKPRPRGWDTFKRILTDYEEPKDVSTQWESTAARKKKNAGIQWEPWPAKQTPVSKRSPVPRLAKQGARKNIL